MTDSKPGTAEYATLRDWFAIHAPNPDYKFWADKEPARYSPAKGQPWVDADYTAREEAWVKWERDRDIAWRWHWADRMLAARGEG